MTAEQTYILYIPIHGSTRPTGRDVSVSHPPSLSGAGRISYSFGCKEKGISRFVERDEHRPWRSVYKVRLFKNMSVRYVTSLLHASPILLVISVPPSPSPGSSSAH